MGAQSPVILVGRTARTNAGSALVVQLAELLQAPVIDTGDRMNMPTNHYLNQSYNRALIGQADVVLSLEVTDLFGMIGDVVDLTQRQTVLRIKPGTKVLEIHSELAVGAGNYQDKQRYYPSDIPVAADAEATLPSLIAAVQSNMTAARELSQNSMLVPSVSARPTSKRLDGSRPRGNRLGCKSRQRSSAVRRGLEPDSQRGLFLRFTSIVLERLAATSLGYDEALS